MVIHKFELQPFEVVGVELEVLGEIVSVINQNDSIMMYARMDEPKHGKTKRAFGCFPTGNSEEFPGLKGRIPRGVCLGTVVVKGLVFHVYEVRVNV